MTTRVRPEDTDLLTVLQARDARLSAIVHTATKYRAILRLELTRLRCGDDPGRIRAGLEPWARVLNTLKRLAGGL